MPRGAPKGNKNHLKHGMRNTRIYIIWRSMRQRCQNPSCSSYKKYGAKGISVCDKWNDFPTFYNWAMENGYTDALTIERKNVYGNYEPDNCTWIPIAEQANNKRSTHWIHDEGKPMSMANYCRKHKLRYKYFSSLLCKGYSVHEATELAV